ncbi:unnamed protein product [Rangifer tarandus platyrhynchus]|uniref:Uncharacterized protein n=1 Tax=Rangifer tarandus platyrhynchus TaxID=3082113 RepID=A0AC59Z3C2_RANTA
MGASKYSKALGTPSSSAAPDTQELQPHPTSEPTAYSPARAGPTEAHGPGLPITPVSALQCPPCSLHHCLFRKDHTSSSVVPRGRGQTEGPSAAEWVVLPVGVAPWKPRVQVMRERIRHLETLRVSAGLTVRPPRGPSGM